MFEVKSNYTDSHFFVVDRGERRPKYLHCDGRVINVCEYFESREAAQAVLDKFYPEPEHVWEHGDVFKNGNGCIMICVANGALGKLKVYYLSTLLACMPLNSLGYTVSCSAGIYFDNAIFLFNIKEKI